MAATVTKRGSRSASVGAGFYDITLTSNVSAGSGIVLIIGSSASAALTISASDTKLNTYQVDINRLDTSNASIYFLSGYAATGLVAGTDTVRFTVSPDTAAFNMLVYEITPINPTDWFDTKVQGTGTTTSSLTPGVSSSVAIAGWCPLSSATFGNIMGSASTGLDNGFGGFSRPVSTEWRELTSTTAGTAAIAGTGAGVYGFATYDISVPSTQKYDLTPGSPVIYQSWSPWTH